MAKLSFEEWIANHPLNSRSPTFKCWVEGIVNVLGSALPKVKQQTAVDTLFDMMVKYDNAKNSACLAILCHLVCYWQDMLEGDEESCKQLALTVQSALKKLTNADFAVMFLNVETMPDWWLAICANRETLHATCNGYNEACMEEVVVAIKSLLVLLQHNPHMSEDILTNGKALIDGEARHLSMEMKKAGLPFKTDLELVKHADSIMSSLSSFPASSNSTTYYVKLAMLTHFLNSFFCKQFEPLRKELENSLMICLQRLYEIHKSGESTLKKEVENVFGAAIKNFGPGLFFEAFSGSDMYESSAWLEFLPVFRKSISKTELQVFVDRFLPVIQRIKHLPSNEGTAQDNRKNEIILNQLWSICPRFCIAPTDLKEAFLLVKDILMDGLTSETALHYILLGLRNLSAEESIVSDDCVDPTDYNAQDFLPALFNLYVTTDTENNNTLHNILATVRSLLLAVHRHISHWLETSQPENCDQMLQEKQQLLPSAYRCVVQLIETCCEQFMMAAPTPKRKFVQLLSETVLYSSRNGDTIFKNIILDGLQGKYDQQLEKDCFSLLLNYMEHLLGDVALASGSHQLSQIAQNLATCDYKVESLEKRFEVVEKIFENEKDGSDEFWEFICQPRIITTLVGFLHQANQHNQLSVFCRLKDVINMALGFQNKPGRKYPIFDYVYSLLASHTDSGMWMCVLKFWEFAVENFSQGEKCALDQRHMEAFFTTVVPYAFKLDLYPVGVIRCMLAYCRASKQCGINGLKTYYPAFLSELFRGNSWKSERSHVRCILVLLCEAFGKEDVLAHVRSDSGRKFFRKAVKVKKQVLSRAGGGTRKHLLSTVARKSLLDMRKRNKRKVLQGPQVRNDDPENIINLAKIQSTSVKIGNKDSKESVGKVKRSSRSWGFPVAADGRLIIMEKETKESAATVLISDADALEKRESVRNKSGEISVSVPGQQQQERDTRTKPVGKNRENDDFGAAVYRSKRARGDMRVRGKPEPHAYISLQRKGRKNLTAGKKGVFPMRMTKRLKVGKRLRS